MTRSSPVRPAAIPTRLVHIGLTIKVRQAIGGTRLNPSVPSAIVIPDDKPHAELWKLADEPTERRGRKRAGIGPNEPVEGRIINQPLHPLEIPSSSSTVKRPL